MSSVLSGYGYTAVAAGVNLALIPVLIGSLGRTGYGVWLTIATLVTWGTVATGWLSPGFVKRIGDHLAANHRELAADAIGQARTLYRGGEVLVLGAGALLASQSHLGFLGGEVTPELRATILLATAWLVIQIEAQIEIATLIASQRLYVVHVTQALTLLASGVLAGGLVLTGSGLPAVAGSYAAAAAAGLVTLKLMRRRLAPPRRTGFIGLSNLREVFATTTPYALSATGWVLLSSDIVLLAILTSPEVVATYGVAFKVVETMIQLIWRPADATQAYIVEFSALGDRAALRRLYQRTNEVTLMLGGSLAAIFFFLGDRFLTLWVGEAQTTEIDVVRLLAVYALLLGFVHANVIFPYSAARMSQIGWLLIAEGAAKVALAWVLIDALGSVGAVLASVLAILMFSGWFAPWYTMRWLEVDAGEFAARIAKNAFALPALTAVAAATASHVVTDRSWAGLVQTGLIALVGLTVGAAITFSLRARKIGAVRSG